MRERMLLEMFRAMQKSDQLAFFGMAKVMTDGKFARGYFQEVGLPDMQASDLPPPSSPLSKVRPTARQRATLHHLERKRKVENGNA
jgi:hypothetical protein